MNIETKNLGNLELEDDKIITFEEGIPGFEHLTRFILLEEKDSKFFYLQSIEEKEVCFVIVDPYVFVKDYAPIIKESYFEKLGGGDDSQFVLYTTVCLKKPIGESTLNLAGPLLIHMGTRLGIQVITEEKMYATKHRLVDLIEEKKRGNE